MSDKAKHAPEAIEAAFAACRSIRFATVQAERHGGEYSLNDLLAAHRLATDALSETQNAATGDVAAFSKQQKRKQETK